MVVMSTMSLQIEGSFLCTARSRERGSGGVPETKKTQKTEKSFSHRRRLSMCGCYHVFRTQNLLREQEGVMDTFLGILGLIYIAAGYWAAGRTNYADKILIGTMQTIFFRKLVLGLMFGWILIPWALIRVFTGR